MKPVKCPRRTGPPGRLHEREPQDDPEREDAEQGAAEGAPFIAKHIIETSDVAFDDFASSGADVEANRRILGLS